VWPGGASPKSNAREGAAQRDPAGTQSGERFRASWSRLTLEPERRTEARSCGWSRLETLLARPYKRICALKTIRAAPGQVEHAKPGNDGKQPGAVTSAVQSHCLFRVFSP
jgi:hypothetical protein